MNVFTSMLPGSLLQRPVQSLELVPVPVLVQSLMLRMHQSLMLLQSLMQSLQGLQHHACESLSQDQKRLTQMQRPVQSLVLPWCCHCLHQRKEGRDQCYFPQGILPQFL